MDLSNKDGLDKFTVDENPVILEGIENIREVLDMGKQRCVIYEDWLCSFIKGQPFFEQDVAWGLRKLEARIQQTLDGSREVIFPMVNGTVYVEVIVVSQFNLKTIRDWDTKLMTSLVTSIAEARYPLTTVKKRRKQLGDIADVPFIKKDEMACPAKCLVCKGVTVKPYVYSNNIPGRYEITQPSKELWICDGTTAKCATHRWAFQFHFLHGKLMRKCQEFLAYKAGPKVAIFEKPRDLDGGWKVKGVSFEEAVRKFSMVDGLPGQSTFTKLGVNDRKYGKILFLPLSLHSEMEQRPISRTLSRFHTELDCFHSADKVTMLQFQVENRFVVDDLNDAFDYSEKYHYKKADYIQYESAENSDSDSVHLEYEQYYF